MLRRFSSKRGRPKIARPSIDRGTPELIEKRARHETTEAIDLCLDRMIISPTEHWCGVHLRWLHTLRYGAPNVQVINLDGICSGPNKQNDCLWNEEREAEYNNAIVSFHAKKLSSPLINICIYNQRVDFLNTAKIQSYDAHKSVERFGMGLQHLELLWGNHS